MGISVFLKSKNRNFEIPFDDLDKVSLSSQFYKFLCGPDTYVNSNFEQIEKILDIDLGILLRLPDNFEEIEDEYHYKIEVAESANDLEKAKELNKELEKKFEEWEENYDTNFKDWTRIEDMENLITNVFQKIKAKPDFYKSLSNQFKNSPELSLSEPDEYYFGLQNDKTHIDNIFTEDLQVILNWIEIAKKENIQYMAFEYA